MNLWWRERHGNTITANDEDIKEAFALWSRISVSQELNIPPYVYELYTQVFIPAFNEKNNKSNDFGFSKDGISRMEIMQKHYQVYKRRLNMNALRFDIIPTLDSAGLITREKDKNDARKEIIFITEFTNTNELENNSASGSGVNNTKDKEIDIEGGVNDEIDF
jgi:hypothetical protein